MDAALNRVLDAFIQAIDLFRFWVVLNEYERGVILRLGRFNRELGPGLHWRLPFHLETLEFLNVRMKQASDWGMTTTTKSGTTVSINFSYVFRVLDARTVLLSLDNWSNTAFYLTKIIIAREVNSRVDDQIFAPGFAVHLEVAVRAELEEFGLELVKFGITELAKTRAYRLFNGAQS